MSSIGKDRLVYIEATPGVSDTIGAFLKVQGGTVLTRTTVGGVEALDTYPVSTFAEDTGHTTGALGQFILGVRNDADAVLTTTDLDYTPLATDSAGRLKVVFAASGTTMVEGTVADGTADADNPVKIGMRAIAGALVNTGIADNDRVDAISDQWRRLFINDSANIDVATTAVAIDDTAGGIDLPATALPGRRRIILQNTGTQVAFIGKSGVVTDADGIRISPNTSLSTEVGDDVILAAICSTGLTTTVRVFELA